MRFSCACGQLVASFSPSREMNATISGAGGRAPPAAAGGGDDMTAPGDAALGERATESLAGARLEVPALGGDPFRLEAVEPSPWIASSRARAS